MKVATLLGDGMADVPLDELSGRTPLEAARTPHMDALARDGAVSVVGPAARHSHEHRECEETDEGTVHDFPAVESTGKARGGLPSRTSWSQYIAPT